MTTRPSATREEHDRIAAPADPPHGAYPIEWNEYADERLELPAASSIENDEQRALGGSAVLPIQVEAGVGLLPSSTLTLQASGPAAA